MHDGFEQDKSPLTEERPGESGRPCLLWVLIPLRTQQPYESIRQQPIQHATSTMICTITATTDVATTNLRNAGVGLSQQPRQRQPHLHRCWVRMFCIAVHHYWVRFCNA